MLVVHRPGAGVVVGDLDAGLGVAGFEELLAERVAGVLGVVVEPDVGLDEAVEDALLGSVGVLQVVRPRGRAHQHARGGRRLEDAERLFGGGEVGGVLQARVRARERLQRGAL